MQPSGGQHPRASMSSEEYDAFGPWVMPVRTPSDVPPLFRALTPDVAGASIVLKVPRKIARRDATPAMDLYDYLLAVHDGALTVLARAPEEPGGVTVSEVPADRLLAIEDSVDLLDGRLVVRALGIPTLVVPYNGASKDVVAGLVAALRQLWLPEPQDVPADDGSRAAAGPAGLGLRDLGDDVALVGQYRELVAAEPTVGLLGAHGRQVVHPTGSGVGGAVAGLAHLLWPMTLQGCVVCTDHRELQVLHRRTWWVRGTRPVHSLARTILPLHRVDRVQVEDHPVYGSVRVVTVGLGPVAAAFPVPAGSATEHALGSALP